MVRRVWRCAVALALLTAGCASGAAGPIRSPGAARTFAPMAIVSVAAQDPTHLVVTAQVPGPKAACAQDLSGRVTDSDSRTVFVQVTFRSAESDCAQTRTESTVVAIPALAGRQVSFGIATDGPWIAAAEGTAFRHCTGAFGCSPPPANHCDPAFLQLAAHSGELQPERSFITRGCTQRWLVLDISATVTGCQPLDGRSAPAGCRTTEVRWFFRFDQGWRQVAAGGRAGCASVHATVPAFPAALCARLPAR